MVVYATGLYVPYSKMENIVDDEWGLSTVLASGSVVDIVEKLHTPNKWRVGSSDGMEYQFQT